MQKLSSDLGCEARELSLLFTDDDEIRQLNSTYRKKDAATDVLSFALSEGSGSEFSQGALGDIVISVETASKNAENFCVPLKSELLRLLIHGLLHLLGFEHENVSLATAQKMTDEEERLHQKVYSELDI